MRPASPGSVAVIDVGGTETKTGLVQPDGSLTDTATTPTPAGADVVDGVLNLVQHHVHRLRGEHRALAGVGLVVPGIVDEDEQVAVLSANLGWQNVPFADLAARRTGLPAALGHDVAAAGLAELELGAAMGADDAAVIPIGTGIAAAVFAGGRAIRGGGFAGELGHTPVVVGGEACTCGSTGCLETIASAAAITRRYTTRSGTVVPGARQVLEAAQAGDRYAQEVWTDATTALARAITQVAAILAPEVVVLGGGLSRAGAALLDPVADQLGVMLTVHRAPRLRLSTLGVHAGLHGAGILARRAARAAGPPPGRNG